MGEKVLHHSVLVGLIVGLVLPGVKCSGDVCVQASCKSVEQNSLSLRLQLCLKMIVLSSYLINLRLQLLYLLLIVPRGNPQPVDSPFNLGNLKIMDSHPPLLKGPPLLPPLKRVDHLPDVPLRLLLVLYHALPGRVDSCFKRLHPLKFVDSQELLNVFCSLHGLDVLSPFLKVLSEPVSAVLCVKDVQPHLLLLHIVGVPLPHSESPSVESSKQQVQHSFYFLHLPLFKMLLQGRLSLLQN